MPLALVVRENKALAVEQLDVGGSELSLCLLNVEETTFI